MAVQIAGWIMFAGILVLMVMGFAAVISPCDRCGKGEGLTTRRWSHGRVCRVGAVCKDCARELDGEGT